MKEKRISVYSKGTGPREICALAMKVLALMDENNNLVLQCNVPALVS